MSEPKATEAVERFATLVRQSTENPASDTQRTLLRARFLERADAELDDVERKRSRLLWALPAFAVGLALAGWFFWPRSLDFQIEGMARDGAYVRAPADRAVTVRFSDQTTVVATAGSRLRVDSAGVRSARVVVERGKANVHVVHDAQREWVFSAGPFEVLVTGTRFSLDWDPATETVDLVLAEGSVDVRGPTGSGPVAVRAGQRFHGDVLRQSLLVSQASGEPMPSATPVSPAEPAVNPATNGAGMENRDPAPRGGGSGSARPSPSASDDWQRRIARGDFASIVAEAEARGVGSCLETCSANDLRALSDAARYTGRNDLAEQGLLALRKRFASGVGRDAPFLLGRLAEKRGALASAETWYGTYLREAPSDTFAAEALAGSMRAARALRGVEAAKPLARDYLKRFPKGVHAATAREILGEG